MKNMSILILLLLIILLTYRVFDLGMSLTFSKNELLESKHMIRMVALYQRKNCSGRDESKSVFRKNGKYHIEGVPFVCLKESGILIYSP